MHKQNKTRLEILNEMKKFLILLLLCSIIGCSHLVNHERVPESKKEECKTDTKILKSLIDSLNSTGDEQYYKKYMIKLDEMIIKYPKMKDLRKVKKSMKQIFEVKDNSSKTSH